MAHRPGIGLVLSLFLSLAWGCGSPPPAPTDPSDQTITPEPSIPPATQATSSPRPETPRPGLTGTPLQPPFHDLWRSDLPEVCPATSEATIELSSEVPGRGVAEIFERQIRDYLNTRGSPVGLQEALGELSLLDGAWQARAQVKGEDVTGNAVPEVLVELTFFEPGQYSEGALFVYRCAGGEYAGGPVLTTAGQVLSAEDPDGIRGVWDMNLDGVPEIVHSYISIAGSHAYFIREFRILAWNGQGFSDLISDDKNGFTALSDNGDGVIEDRDGNGTLELILSNGVGEAYPDLGPQRARNDIWEWNGGAFSLARWETTDPIFRIHAIWDGDDAMRFGELERALVLYQDAVFNERLLGWSSGRLWPDGAYGSAPTPPPDPGERHRLNAYGRYRILLVHAAQGREAEAKIVYDALRARYPGGSAAAVYTALAEAFWEAYSGGSDLRLACGKAVEFAKAHPSDVLSPLGRDFYGSGQRQYQPEEICPFGDKP